MIQNSTHGRASARWKTASGRIVFLGAQNLDIGLIETDADHQLVVFTPSKTAGLADALKCGNAVRFQIMPGVPGPVAVFVSKY